MKEGKPGYVVKVPRSRKDLVSAILKLIADADKLYKPENDNLPRIHFDRHLYLPLLLKKGDESLKAVPPALTESEAQFVCDLCRDARPAPQPSPFYVYAIECEDGSLYIGHTDNL